MNIVEIRLEWSKRVVNLRGREIRRKGWRKESRKKEERGERGETEREGERERERESS